ncbi:hypothetical protein PC118_g21018 [Phytophthora cactorum]|uniref:Uncharacterized protein n=2 Tax=Phytophthora cactorum TaxID=29920 RepID=A0A8T1F112_9STRA|nr:hypothetical protein PC118_g21018 [Phytophthora cactorum]
MRNLVRKLTPALTGGVLIYKDSNINMVMVEGGKKTMKHVEHNRPVPGTNRAPQASGHPKLLHATDTAVMELIDNLRNAVLQQREHEVTNFFTNVNELREFISAREPAAGVNITVKMCCYNCEILSADTGSRITLVSWSAHAMFEEVREALNELNSVNRKPFIAQVTVWDSKKKVGSPKTGRLHFRVGAVYEFKQVHSVGYFSDIAKGSVQLEDGASDVDAANTESLLANDVPIVHINALHHVQQKRLHQKREIPEGTTTTVKLNPLQKLDPPTV